MEIKVLGTGCPKCKTLERKTLEVIASLGLDAKVEKVEDIVKIMEYGVLHTPALVIDEQVVMSGRLPSKKDLEELLTQKQ